MRLWRQYSTELITSSGKSSKAIESPNCMSVRIGWISSSTMLFNSKRTPSMLVSIRFCRTTTKSSQSFSAKTTTNLFRGSSTSFNSNPLIRSSSTFSLRHASPISFLLSPTRISFWPSFWCGSIRLPSLSSNTRPITRSENLRRWSRSRRQEDWR